MTDPVTPENFSKMQPIPRRIGKWLIEVFPKVEKISVIALVLLLFIAVFTNMCMRYLPISTGLFTMGVEEFGRLCLVWLWLWAGAIIHRKDEHYKFTLITDRLRKKSLWVFATLTDLITLVILTVLFKEFWNQFQRSIGLTTLALQLPQAIFNTPLLLGPFLMMLYTIIRLTIRLFGDTLKK